MSYLRSSTILFGFSAAAALALAIGCSQNGEDGDSASADDSTSDAGAQGAPLPSPDYVATGALELINMSQSDGKIAIVPTATPLNNCGAAGTLCDEKLFVDMVGFGKATQFETAPVPTLLTTGSPANAAIRKLGGCEDFWDNATDFTIATAAPRNGATSPSALCSTVDAGAPPAPPAADAGATDAGSGSSDSDAGDDAGAPAVTAAVAHTVTPGLVISQVYGGGGNSKATFQNDFVELFNRSDAAISLKDFSLQYTGFDKNFANTASLLNLPDKQLAPGHYFLVQLAGAATSSDGGAPHSDGGKTDGGYTSHSDGGSSKKGDAGKGGSTSNGGLESPDDPGSDGSEDPDGTHPESAADGAKPPAFPATSPSCSATMSTTGSSAFAGLFGLGLVVGALRRRRK